MTKSTAKVVAHSKGPNGDELITIVGTFPRIILAEVNTHRMLSKNTSSSRAIPFFKMVKSISDNPFIPYAFQKHHSGMQGTEYLDPNRKITWEEVQPIIHEMVTKNFSLEDGDWAEIEFAMNEYVWPLFKVDETGRTPAEWWLQVRNIVVGCAVMIYAMGVTKQIANRLLEPFMWVTDIITGTKDAWESFFYLRAPKYTMFDADGYHEFRSRSEALCWANDLHYSVKNSLTEEDYLLINKGQAEIHMMDFAESCWNAIRKSKPRELKGGEWHIPFRDKLVFDPTVYRDVFVYSGLQSFNLLNHSFREGDFIVFIDDFGRHEALVERVSNSTIFFKATKGKLISGTYSVFLNGRRFLSNNDILKISTAMCARVSYTVVGDEKETTPEALIKVYDEKLINQDPPHSSPFEHCARVMITKDDEEEAVDNEYFHFVKGNDLGQSPEYGWCNNFKGFIQLRYLIEKENFKL